MATEALTAVLRYIRHLAGANGDDEQSDGQLLRQFVAQRDEGAFAAILQRYGPLVFRVCWQVLRNPHDAEDAFQATFLVLARKAASIRKQASLAAWLHRVALNIARTAKTNTAQRRVHERQAVLMSQASSMDEVALRDWQPLMHEEVDRLPEKYRVPVVLCYFEGKTHDEAARQLGWPLGTVKGRLARARDLLKDRLARRGLALSAAGLAAALTQNAAQAAVPPALLGLTLRAALSFVARGAIPAGAVSAQAVTLAKGALQTMTATKLVSILVLVTAIGVVGFTVALGPNLGREARPEAGAAEVEQAGSPANPSRPAEAKAKGSDAHGDPLPAGALARLGTLRFRHGRHIQAIAFSPDGEMIASAGDDGRVVLHDPSTGKKLRSLGANEPLAHSVAFAPDGKTLAAALGTRLVCLWEVATGNQIRQFQVAEGPVRYLAFSPDGRTLVGGVFHHAVYVWDVRAGTGIGRIGLSRDFHALALAPDGKTFAAAVRESKEVVSLCLWETVGGRKLHQWQAHKGEGCTLAFSPDGKRLASASVEGDNRLRMWAVPTGERQLDLLGAFPLCFSPSGRILAATLGGSFLLLDADTGKEIRRIPKSNEWVSPSTGVAFRPDGKVLAVADPWTITLWEVAGGKQLSPSLDGHEQVVESVRFLADGKTLATTSRGAVSVWQVHSGERIVRFEGPRSDRPAISPDGKVLAVPGGSQTIGLWDAATGRKLRELEAPPKDALLALVFSPDGKTLIAAIGDGTIRFWDVVTGKRIPRLALHEATYANLAFSPDGKTLAVGNGDLGLVEDHRKLSKVPTVRLLDAVTGRELRKPFELPEAASSQGRSPRWVSMGQVAFSADGKVLAAAVSSTSRLGTDPTIQVWEVETGRVLCHLDRVLAGAGELGRRFALSPDGKSLVTPGEVPRLWEVATGKLRGQIRGHSDWVWAADFSPDGRLLASGSQDTTVLIWDVLNVSGEPPAAKNLAPKQLEALWADLAGADAAQAYRAIRALVAAPAAAVPFLRQHLRPVPAPDATHITGLIADLDAEQFSVREKARRELDKLGAPARPALRQALSGQPSAELRRRVESLLEKPQPVSLTAEELQVSRALEVLEYIGTPAARKALETLAQGAPGARQTEEASAALKRLAKWAAVPP